MARPIIGIVLDWDDRPSYSAYPWYALRENYARAIEKAGGTPILLPHHCDQIPEFINLISGLLIPGGDYDIDPAHYGENICHERVICKASRTTFELKIAQIAYQKDLPMLGICGGHQLINVMMGGSLIQHIPASIESTIEHEQKSPKHMPSHSIHIEKNTLLFDLCGTSEIQVNSTHHQAIKTLGAQLKIAARAPDSVIEAIENPQKKFCLGVQWHPEYLSTPYDYKIFDAFITACQQ
ncbi:MAG: gamma-glutamyl-gamma-aminobutyrate hydrolase [Caedibacter sp. 37-49]|nr:MAG: gamma-glutamyl-gamma-aminobutyrate hydrolase [Caedibacter sp. 37-49]